jgi:transposase
MMKNRPNNSRKASVGREERVSAQSETKTRDGIKYDCIKVAIDAHAEFFMVARQIDGSVPERPRKMSHDQLMKFMNEQVKPAKRVVSCYEAGCFGFVLHRELEKLGVESLVICPQDLDERNKKVKTDRTDTCAMLSRLDRYVAGNKKALAVVRVPSEAQELRRGRCRLRQVFKKEKQRWAARGRSLLLNHGIRIGGKWWREDRWEELVKHMKDRLGRLAGELIEMLKEHREMAMKMEQKAMELTEQLEKSGRESKAPRFKGMGPLLSHKLLCEVCDWSRFENRRQVASYTGLCPAVNGSGGRFQGGSITRCGNSALRADLLELAWLVYRYQSDYPPLKKWKDRIRDGPGSVRKKAMVAIARRLAIDIWRLNTGRATAGQLGLMVMKEAA